MSCNTLGLCNPIAKCTETLILFDTPPYLTGDVYVYIMNTCNGAVTKHDAIDVYGVLQIELTRPLEVECTYKVWVNDSETNSFEKADITIDGEVFDTLEFSVFKRIDNTQSEVLNIVSQLSLI